MRAHLIKLGYVIIGVIPGIFIAAYTPELTKCIRGISGYVEVAKYRVALIGDHISSKAHGLEYLKINSEKRGDTQFSLHLEYRIEGQSSNNHDLNPLLEGKEYRYSWRDSGYILKIESIPKSIDGADVSIFQSNIDIN